VVPAAVAVAGACYLAEMAVGAAVPEIEGRRGPEAANLVAGEEGEVVVLEAVEESIRMADPKAVGSSWRASPFLRRRWHVLKKGHSVRAKNLSSTRCPRAMVNGTGTYRRAGMAVG
jgi:hypothetical protein